MSFTLGAEFNPAQVKVRDSGGAILYSATRYIWVSDPVVRFNLTKSVYSEMLVRLKAGAIDSASTALTDSVYDKYRSTFIALGASLPTTVDQLGTVKYGNVAERITELGLVRTDSGGQAVGYFVSVIRGGDGVWRIDGM